MAPASFWFACRIGIADVYSFCWVAKQYPVFCANAVKVNCGRHGETGFEYLPVNNTSKRIYLTGSSIEGVRGIIALACFSEWYGRTGIISNGNDGPANAGEIIVFTESFCLCYSYFAIARFISYVRFYYIFFCCIIRLNIRILWQMEKSNS